jgi:hypothetical protein
MESLTNYQVNGLSRQVHDLLMNNKYSELQILLEKYGMSNLSNTKNKGIISLILQYGINTNNIEIINSIFPYLSMKRDYLNYILYHKENKEHTIEIFTKYIKPDSILQKDIEFISENNLIYLLTYLEGTFIKMDIEGYLPPVNFQKFLLKDTEFLFSKISRKINPNDLIKFTKKIENSKYNFIIDAGNILFSRNGNFTDNSIEDLAHVINHFKNNFIIIHTRHLKNDKIKKLLIHKNYFSTPYNYNDDIFVLLSYLHNCNSCIITNDNYKDHTFEDNNLRNYISDDIIKYTNKNGIFTFEPKRKYTRNIQVIDNRVYVPGTIGFIDFGPIV